MACCRLCYVPRTTTRIRQINKGQFELDQFAAARPFHTSGRPVLNEFIKSSRLFDDVVDFYAVTTDPQTGAYPARLGC
jgi:hypothetical protein